MRWTLNTVWFLYLEVMEKHGITRTRAHIKNSVRKLCAEAGVTRESLGIFAGVRAALYFNCN